ncbi:hypothetical protein ABZP36_006147 [Zizania latifolia]
MADIDGAYRFFPSDEHLTDCYLRQYLVQTKLADLPASVSSFFHEVDVYSASPEQLVANLAPARGTGDGDRRVWYMFSPVRSISSRVARKSRVVGPNGNESWHAEGSPKNVKGSTAGGKLQKFSYKIKTASGVVKPGWLMVEYSIPGADHLVLCKVYRSPRSSSSSTASSIASISGCKRKAEEDHPEAPVCSAPRQTPPEEGHDDSLRFAENPEILEGVLHTEQSEHNHGDAATGTASMSEQLYNLQMPIPVQEEEDAYYKSLGFDEQADPRCWDRFLFEDELPPCAPPAAPSQPAETAMQGPCPEEKEQDELKISGLPCPEFEDELPLCTQPAAATAAAANQPAETAVQGPCPEEEKQDELMITGLPCPEFDPAYVEHIIRSYGDNLLPLLSTPDISIFFD